EGAARGAAVLGARDRGGAPGAAGAEDEVLVAEPPLSRHVVRFLQDAPVGPDAHRAETHVDIGERDDDEAAPRDRHVATVETAHAGVGALLRRALRYLVETTAHQMPQGMTSKGVGGEEHDVERQD